MSYKDKEFQQKLEALLAEYEYEGVMFHMRLKAVPLVEVEFATLDGGRAIVANNRFDGFTVIYPRAEKPA